MHWFLPALFLLIAASHFLVERWLDHEENGLSSPRRTKWLRTGVSILGMLALLLPGMHAIRERGEAENEAKAERAVRDRTQTKLDEALAKMTSQESKIDAQAQTLGQQAQKLDLQDEKLTNLTAYLLQLLPQSAVIDLDAIAETGPESQSTSEDRLNPSHIPAYTRQCADGVLEACHSLGRIQVLADRFQDAIEPYDRACLGGKRWSCQNLGTLYFSPKQLGPDFERAAHYYDLGCKLKLDKSCDDLKVALRREEEERRRR